MWLTLDLFFKIWPQSEMRQVLLNSCWKDGFANTICKQPKTNISEIDSVEIRKKTLKFA